MPTSLPSRYRPAMLGLTLAVSSALLYGCGDKPQEPPKPATAARPATSVTVASAELKSVPVYVDVDAELVSLSAPTVSAEVAGKLVSVLVQPGQQVQRGQVLAILDNTDLALSAADVQAQAAQAQTLLAEKERALTRNEALFEKGYISKSVRDASATEAGIARAQLDASQARLELSLRNKEKTRIVAPYAATVVSVPAMPGAYLRVGDPVANLWSAAQANLTLRVPQTYLGKVQPGQAVTLHWADTKLESKVIRTSSRLDPASRSFEVQASIPSALQGKSGAVLKATIKTGAKEQVLIPAGAVQLAGDKARVATVVEGIAKFVEVKVGGQRNGQVEVLEGLAPGTSIVVEGASFVNEGQPVSTGAPR